MFWGTKYSGSFKTVLRTSSERQIFGRICELDHKADNYRTFFSQERLVWQQGSL